MIVLNLQILCYATETEIAWLRNLDVSIILCRLLHFLFMCHTFMNLSNILNIYSYKSKFIKISRFTNYFLITSTSVIIQNHFLISSLSFQDKFQWSYFIDQNWESFTSFIYKIEWFLQIFFGKYWNN